MAAAKAFERYFYDFSLHPAVSKFVPSKGQYIALRHVTFCAVGLMGLINFNFPFNPPFPTIGMCPSGWKGTWVCEADKHKAMEMYTEWKTGKAAVAQH
eukprot:CAMPEP_0119109516 /NCGR_PEP_ID=MMETSP1180-20130426/19110_1 /TAXON_ID=3052 ORGANISM="Chlamydomonas cf sp, Strain CCMP681" /NCGR_SAMPLE_ID=MMETSP1180 /ASSEMBLY_ACC=CAM_ASM_000741 /LENGTH=97 /DNA_ID=CAMNT_0007095305 /DNA_START=35 /DNA_END=331 /DNA_ORIENTATION=-